MRKVRGGGPPRVGRSTGDGHAATHGAPSGLQFINFERIDKTVNNSEQILSGCRPQLL